MKRLSYYYTPSRTDNFSRKEFINEVQDIANINKYYLQIVVITCGIVV